MRRLPLDYAVRNLGRSKSRLGLIVFGSALLVLILLAAAAFVRGMDQSLRATGSENNIILLGTGSEESVERSEVGVSVAGVAAASIHGIREFAGVPYVSPEVNVMLPVQLDASDATMSLVSLRGVTPA